MHAVCDVYCGRIMMRPYSANYHNVSTNCSHLETQHKYRLIRRGGREVRIAVGFQAYG